jgi:RNA polymerase sigma-70 factor, ECF subfamily
MADDAARLDEAMTRYAAGEDRAFEIVYALLSSRLYGFCLRLAVKKNEADDLFQETFLKLHRARATFIPGSTASHWAFAIARSVYLDRLRYRKRRPEDLTETGEGAEAYSPSATAVASPEAHAQARQLMSVIERVLANLPENQRTAYVLLKEEGLSVADAAAVLGATPTAVKLRAHRAYEALRAAIAEAEGVGR